MAFCGGDGAELILGNRRLNGPGVAEEEVAKMVKMAKEATTTLLHILMLMSGDAAKTADSSAVRN